MAEIKNYPSNSIKSRENTSVKKTKPEIVPVVEEGDAKVVAPRLGRKIFNAFFPEATNKPIGSFFLFDLCIPAVRNFIGSILISGGKSITGGYNNGVFTNGKKSYESYYNGKVSYMNSPQKRSKIYDCEHVWYSSLQKAQDVIDQMNTVLKEYPVVSVADMKELSKLSHEITPGDYHAGWNDIHDVKWYSDHGGYTVVFPPTIEL
jgi:hypothetical protein